MVCDVNRFDLPQGKWVEISWEEKFQAQESHMFKIVTRQDDSTPLMDYCRCWLLDLQGKLVDYYPGMSLLGGRRIPNFHVVILEDVYVKERLGDEKFEYLESIACSEQQRLIQSVSQVAAERFSDLQSFITKT